MNTSIRRVGAVLTTLTVAAIAIGYARNSLPLGIAGFVVFGILPLLSVALIVTAVASLAGKNRVLTTIELLVALWGGYVFYSLVFMMPI